MRFRTMLLLGLVLLGGLAVVGQEERQGKCKRVNVGSGTPVASCEGSCPTCGNIGSGCQCL